MAEPMCHCGRPLHYNSPEVRLLIEALVAREGEYARIVTPDGTFLVQRHYIALHGIQGWEVAQLGFEKVADAS